MKQLFISTLCVFLFAACNSGADHKTDKEEQSDIYTVEDTDEGMNTAIKAAIQSLDKFNKALQSNNETCVYFAIKSRFKTPQGGEHIWVSNIRYVDGDYFGVVDNLPEATTDVHLGDTIKIFKNNISDWMYLENGVLRGGYTIRLLRDRMSPSEKKQFDASSGMIIE